ncbi:major facilitator superfamily domain-containing protein 6-like isoform X2 [Centruroides sculpturatus]|uniref:major facilitator superfamily domain-containing protein 6-like isoform X2 n=1 Tax=Centruroides sculpturatus TaxID=218467 RepID=UPI000C6CBD51|nr:major facilitator superfamily domain-containing protein 6-like isoform X2 [Centruroides sculpturatus]
MITSLNCSINRKMLPMKLHYLFYALGTGAVLPFFPLIAKNIGISASGLGLTFAVVPFFTIIVNPLFGVLTDKFKKIKFILMFFIAIQSIFYFSINFIPRIEKEKIIFSDIKFHCDDGNMKNFTKNSNISSTNTYNNTLQCRAICFVWNNSEVFSQNSFNFTRDLTLNNDQDLQIDNFTSSICSQFNKECQIKCFVDGDEEDNSFVHYQYWLFVIITAIPVVITNAIIAISDTACYESLEGRVNQFGKQRVWLSIGWGIIQLTTGYVVELANKGNDGKTDFSICFYVMLPLKFIDIIVVSFTDMKKEKTSRNIFKDVRKIFVKLHPFIFIIAVFFIGAINGMLWNYAFWYFEQLGANKIFMGITSAVNVIFAEVPFMFVSGWIIKRIGRDNSISMAFLSSPAYGLFQAVMTSYGKLVAPPGTEATMQTILGATFHGLGIGTGSLLGGFSFDNFGGRMTYRFLGYFTLITAAVYKCITLFIAGENTVIKEEERNKRMDMTKTTGKQ